MPHSENRSNKNIDIDLRKSIEVLYQEGIRIHLYIVEWRHKIMIRFFLSVAALLITAGWLWERKNDALEDFLFLPFLISALISFGYFLLDRRIVSQIDMSHKMAIRLERELYEKGGHFVSVLERGRLSAGKQNNRLSIISYTFVLEFFYLFTCLISFILSIIIFIRFSII